MKVIFDTNVIVAAFASRGLAKDVFELCLENHTVIISKHILSELQKAFRNKLKMPEKAAGVILAFLKEECQLEKEDTVEENACRDPDDLKILGLAANTKAPYLITGDQDLLVLKRFGPTIIVNPRGFWNYVKKEQL